MDGPNNTIKSDNIDDNFDDIDLMYNNDTNLLNNIENNIINDEVSLNYLTNDPNPKKNDTLEKNPFFWIFQIFGDVVYLYIK